MYLQQPVTAGFVEAQLDSVFTDLNIVAVKVGMLSDANVINAVSAKLKQYQPKFLLVDPVMVATSGDLLLQESAINTLKSDLLPLADIITPNLPEAAALVGADTPKNEQQMTALVEQLRTLETGSILLKGGHLEQESNSTDLLIRCDTVTHYSSARINTKNTHGTGCTLSSAITSYFAQGHSLEQAISLGKTYITNAISHADKLDIGKGHGPVHHFYASITDAWILDDWDKKRRSAISR